RCVARSLATARRIQAVVGNWSAKRGLSTRRYAHRRAIGQIVGAANDDGFAFSQISARAGNPVGVTHAEGWLEYGCFAVADSGHCGSVAFIVDRCEWYAETLFRFLAVELDGDILTNYQLSIRIGHAHVNRDIAGLGIRAMRYVDDFSLNLAPRF